MGNGPITNSPTMSAEEFEELLEKYGRVHFCGVPIEFFNGTDGYTQLIPKENEIAVGPMGEFYNVSIDKNGNTVIQDFDMQLYRKLQKLENSGAFDLGRMFLFNKRVNHLLFYNSENALGTNINMPSNRVFPTAYKYWAVRKISDENTIGEYLSVYMVPNIGTSRFIPMEVKNYQFNDAIKNQMIEQEVSVAKTGSASINLVDKEFYRVEFYDADKTLIETEMFQAIDAKRVMNVIDTDENVSIIDIIVTTNRETTNPPTINSNNATCYLYEGESPEILQVYVSLKLSNGSVLDITNLKDIDWRIEGLEAITTGPEMVSGNAQTNQMFTVKYIGRTSENLEGVNNHYITFNPETSTSKTVEVYVLQDTRPKISEVKPIVFSKLQNSVPTIQVKFYALYDTGETRDVTHNVLADNNVSLYNDFYYDEHLNSFIANNTFMNEGGSAGVKETLPYRITIKGDGLKEFEFTFMFELDNPQQISGINPITVPGSVTYAIVNGNITKASYNKLIGSQTTPVLSGDPSVVYDIHQMYCLSIVPNTSYTSVFGTKLEADSVGIKMHDFGHVAGNSEAHSIEYYKTKYGKDDQKELYMSVRSGVNTAITLVSIKKVSEFLQDNIFGETMFNRRKDSEYVYDNAPLIFEFYHAEAISNNMNSYKRVGIEIGYLKNTICMLG